MSTVQITPIRDAEQLHGLSRLSLLHRLHAGDGRRALPAVPEHDTRGDRHDAWPGWIVLGSFSRIVPSKGIMFAEPLARDGLRLFRLKPGSDTPTIIDINPGEATSFVDNLTVFKGRSISPPRQRRTARNSTGSALAARRPNSSTSTWARPVRPLELTGDKEQALLHGGDRGQRS